MAEAEHTPTPWFLDPDDRPNMAWNSHICSDEAHNNRICFMSFAKNSVADAAFIVRACNAHDDLVAALKALRQVAIWDDESDRTEFDAACNLADAALAKAEGR